MLPLCQWKQPPTVDMLRRCNALRSAVRRLLPGSEDAWPPEVSGESFIRDVEYLEIAFYLDFILTHLSDDRRPWR